MKSFFYATAFATAASAVVLRRDQCCFQITASGGVSGIMGQLIDGQNRINGSYAPETYCYSNGGITDSHGRGCIVTLTNDATHQFQCDLGKAPTYSFSIATNGSILYQGNDQFYVCPATDTEYNVYTQWLKYQEKCKPVKLSTNGTCAGASTSGGFSAPSGTGYSIPAYASTGGTGTTPVSTPATSVPIYNSFSSASVPAYSDSSEVFSSYGSTSQSIVSSWSSQEPAPAYSPQSTVAVSSETWAIIPGYESISIPTSSSASQPTVLEYSSSTSTPVENSQTESATLTESTASVESTTVVVPSYSAGSSSNTPMVVTLETTVWTTHYSATETQVTDGITYTSVYPTVSTTTQKASTPVVPESSVSTGNSSIPAPTGSVSVPSFNSTSQSTVPSYGSSQTTVPIHSTEPTSASTSAATMAPMYSQPSTTSGSFTSATACQTSLTGAYQTPHLIIPIASSYPDTPQGTSYNGTINSDCSTIFNFDIPSSYEGMTCSVIFLFPKQEDLETSAYTFSGSGDLAFSEMSGVATDETTYNNAPAKNETLNIIAIQSGNSYVVSTGTCASGTTESIELSSQNGLSLEFFEDWNPSSLGLYITAC